MCQSFCFILYVCQNIFLHEKTQLFSHRSYPRAGNEGWRTVKIHISHLRQDIFVETNISQKPFDEIKKCISMHDNNYMLQIAIGFFQNAFLNSSCKLSKKENDPNGMTTDKQAAASLKLMLELAKSIVRNASANMAILCRNKMSVSIPIHVKRNYAQIRITIFGIASH